jgi:hypothetical protein
LHAIEIEVRDCWQQVRCAGGTVTPADAACKKALVPRERFRQGRPTKDAKDLLDKYIADWTKEHGITKYTVGKKDVTCELYLN